MKAIKIVYGVILIVSVSSLLSCKKWLDEKPSTLLSTPETLRDLQAMMDNGSFINFQITPSLPESSADNYFLLKSTIDLSNQLRDPYAWEAIFPRQSSNDWRSSYIPVYNVNVCLERLEDIPKTASNSREWDNVKGSALFLRSYFFLQLLWTFSKAYDPVSAGTDLGIALRLGSDFNVPSVRTSVQEGYQQIINDTKEAINYLPDLPIHPMRPSRAAGYGLLARTYLSMRDYVNALKYADLSLQISNELIDFNADASIVSSIQGILPPFRRFNKETIFYTEMNLNYPTCNSNYAKVDSVLYEQYATSDLRKLAFFRQEGAYQLFKGSYTQHPIVLFTGIATDEMYLTRAECLARVGNGGSGDKEAALADLSTLLEKRWKTGDYTTPTAANAKEALEIILRERRKELIFRGLRWMDIKRLNKENYNIELRRIINGQSYVLPPNDNRYALPLPQEIIDITGMPQNPR